VQQDSDPTLLAAFTAGRTSSLTIDQHHVGDVTVLRLSGQLLLDDGEIAFRTVIERLLAEGHLKLVLDLDGITQLDSSGVGMLVGRLQAIRKLGGDIRLVHLASRYQQLLTTMRVLSLFSVFDDEAAAVLSYGNAASGE
jgi:anti-sigma B factor antagonist